MNALKIADAKHESLIGDITTLKTDVQALKLSTLTTDNKIAFFEKYAKQVWAVGGGFVIYLWTHASVIMKTFGQ